MSVSTIHIQVLTHNNERHLRRCLSSLLPLGAAISVYDTGSTDKTAEIAQEFGSFYKIPPAMNRSQIRNMIIQKNESEWQMYIHPWEALTDCSPLLEAIKNESDYFHLMILQNNSITKDVRLWRRAANLKFENYAFETINVTKPNILHCMVHSAGFPQNYQENLLAWAKDKPTAGEPLYYRACQHLIKQEWKEFIILANHYLMLNTKATMSVVMTKYYLATIYLHIKQDYQMAIKHLLEIITVKPLMAEFWCLLGDVYYKLHEYQRAKHLYENALILSKKRATDDLWPIEINKYKAYPQQMVDSCEQLEKHTVCKKPLV